ncbi:tryptophan synthase subunit alpha [Mesonia ostreae]|uniref:Tryptophan synthase alpha chain n=1 Tax=Mesonia ostreae TaxID=861110 RepID=A0ABU2KEQ3_9FLAO|nr:tryptophan synthase subunit alpha [Mesonia ostreae]MDT0293196.1 tryptophan synthase subunit alpha [Mesonia ostreae]
MNRIQTRLQQNKKILSIYFTAGFPKLEDTVPIIKSLEENGVDMIEIGLPFSDPLADGPSIQSSSTQALKNGMTSKILFEQLKDIRESVKIPLLIMGYFNPIFQYGVEKFCKKCQEIGIDGLIIPDLPLEVYEEAYQSIFENYGLLHIFLITPQTSEERIRKIDAISKGFIYMVSSASVTGGKNNFGEEQLQYFERIYNLNLKTPKIIGFGISNKNSFLQATQFSNGGIIGSAFVNFLKANSIEQIDTFTRKFNSIKKLITN